MKAVIYCRKSTDNTRDQAQSLDIQLEWAENYIEQNNISVVETIVESKSAFKSHWRDGFERMMELFIKWDADTLIVYQLDRICRNPLDEGAVKHYTQQGNIKQIISSQGTFDGRQILTLSLFLAMANQYSIDHSTRVSNGRVKKVQSWWISWKAPLWYENNHKDFWNAIVWDDSVYIKRIFEMKAEGHSLRLIEDQVYQEGFRTTKWSRVTHSVIERIIQNPFYYWYIKYKWELFKWNHTPLISKDLYDRVNKKWRGIITFTDVNILPLKWMVKHKETWDTLDCYLAKKKYIFFRSSSRKDYKVSMSQSKIIEYFDEHIHLYGIPEEYKEPIEDDLNKKVSGELEENKKQALVLNKKITRLESEVKELRWMRRRREIWSDDFIEDKNQLTSDIEDLHNRLIGLNRINSETITQIEILHELLINLVSDWKSFSSLKKSKIIAIIVSELKIDNQKRLYIEENPIFKSLRMLNCSNWWSKCYSERTVSPFHRYMINNREKLERLNLCLEKILD